MGLLSGITPGTPSPAEPSRPHRVLPRTRPSREGCSLATRSRRAAGPSAPTDDLEGWLIELPDQIWLLDGEFVALAYFLPANHPHIFFFFNYPSDILKRIEIGAKSSPQPPPPQPPPSPGPSPVPFPSSLAPGQSDFPGAAALQTLRLPLSQKDFSQMIHDTQFEGL